VFRKQDAEVLPPHRGSEDHKINVEPGSKLSYRRSPGFSPDELAAIRKFVEDEIRMRIDPRSTSPASSPLLLVKKPGGGIRVCVDYRELNAITVKDFHSVPLIRETLDWLSQARWYKKLDVIAAFYRLRLKEEDEYLTAFSTRYGHYEFCVPSFSLCNGPSSFQRYINNTLREFLDDFASAYLDDVLAYSITWKEHVRHVRKILTNMHEAGL
jgi:hypothetical protein